MLRTIKPSAMAFTPRSCLTCKLLHVGIAMISINTNKILASIAAIKYWGKSIITRHLMAECESQYRSIDNMVSLTCDLPVIKIKHECDQKCIFYTFSASISCRLSAAVNAWWLPHTRAERQWCICTYWITKICITTYHKIYLHGNDIMANYPWNVRFCEDRHF